MEKAVIQQVYVKGIGMHDAIPASRLHTGVQIICAGGAIEEVREAMHIKTKRKVVVRINGANGQVYTRKYRDSTLIPVKIPVKLCKGCIADMAEYYPYIVSQSSLIITEVPLEQCDNTIAAIETGGTNHV